MVGSAAIKQGRSANRKHTFFFWPNQHICMNQLSQTYYSSKHVIYWFAAIMIKCLGPNAHLEPLVLAHINFFLKNATAPVLRLLSHSLSV